MATIVLDRYNALHNQILGALPAEVLERIEPHLELVHLKLGDVVCEAGSIVQYAYFPEGCVLSLLTLLENGDAIETANIGREGTYGLSALYSRMSFNRCIVQLEGTLLRCNIDVLHKKFKNNENIRNLFSSYEDTLVSQIQQTVACNALHTVQQKMSRWLLMMADRSLGHDMAYTHEFLSNILGVNRKSITMAAQAMKSAGLIEYRRGTMQVHDRRALEAASCECYAIIKARFDEFLNPPSTAVQDTAPWSGNRIN